MQELRELARSDEIAGFITDPPSNLSPETVQGVNLAIDRFWLRYYRANFSYWTDESPASGSYRTRRVIKGHRLDFSWRPSGWAEHCRARGYPTDAHPVVIQVLLRKAPYPGFLAEVPTSIAGHPVRYELRAPCEAFAPAALCPGAKVARQASDGTGAWVPGTLGGFLKDSSTGATYAVSCAHVFGDVGTRIYSRQSGASVGEVRCSSLPPASSTATKCNRVAQSAVADMAAAEIDQGIAVGSSFAGLGQVDQLTPIADMTSDDLVSFLGSRKRKLVPAKIGALNIWREIIIDGQPHCMGDMFIIQPRHPGYVRSKLSRPGDSGAWVVSTDNALTAWDGMVTGGDGPDVYCSFAETIFAICSAANSCLVLGP